MNKGWLVNSTWLGLGQGRPVLRNKQLHVTTRYNILCENMVHHRANFAISHVDSLLLFVKKFMKRSFAWGGSVWRVSLLLVLYRRLCYMVKQLECVITCRQITTTDIHYLTLLGICTQRREEDLFWILLVRVFPQCNVILSSLFTLYPDPTPRPAWPLEIWVQDYLA